MKILLTGYSGFVGRPLLERLESEKISVIKAGRSADSDFRLTTIGEETVWDKRALLVDAVVHLAAHVHQMSEPDLSRYFEVNVRGTLNLAEQAAKAGVKLFIYMSSVKACGEASEPGSPLTMDSHCCPTDPYGQSKLEAEKALQQLGKDYGMRVICLRPPLVYGPGVGANFRSLMKLVGRGIPLPLGGLTNKRSLVYVHNLVDCVIQSLKSKNVSGSYFVSDDNDLSTSQLVEFISSGLGKRPLLFSLPDWFWMIIGKVGFLKGPAQRLTGDLQVDIAATKIDLDWAPPFSTQEGIYATAYHYQNALR